jgi:2-polyprenyl-3-methyl-5-hydroxy-6-metoxy-1,4-benzoquinol methylase
MSYLPYLDKPNRWSSHSQIITRLSSFSPGTRVLDIGTATGTIGRMGQSLGLKFFGIEPNSEWAEKASPYYESIAIETLETCPKHFLSNYQVIVLADVLEHMIYPEQNLQYLINLQPNGTQLIISVPNIANIYIGLSLLSGKFDYSDRGILDHTHLRFFTQKTVLQLIANLNLKVIDISTTPIPLEKVSPFFENSTTGRLIYHALKLATDIFPTILGYQFIITAAKE